MGDRRWEIEDGRWKIGALVLLGQIIFPMRINGGVELVTLDEVPQITDDGFARNFEVARKLRNIRAVIGAAKAFEQFVLARQTLGEATVRLFAAQFLRA